MISQKEMRNSDHELHVSWLIMCAFLAVVGVFAFREYNGSDITSFIMGTVSFLLAVVCALISADYGNSFLKKALSLATIPVSAAFGWILAGIL
ncbi:MAG TPA: hypothetical protein VEA59_01785 [Patescibacteria group bacterium]|nr:hypothetical protein [Patescibacteria group bacterium]